MHKYIVLHVFLLRNIIGSPIELRDLEITAIGIEAILLFLSPKLLASIPDVLLMSIRIGKRKTAQPKPKEQRLGEDQKLCLCCTNKIGGLNLTKTIKQERRDK